MVDKISKLEKKLQKKRNRIDELEIALEWALDEMASFYDSGDSGTPVSWRIQDWASDYWSARAILDLDEMQDGFSVKAHRRPLKGD